MDARRKTMPREINRNKEEILLSLVLPAYNEEDNLDKCTKLTLEALDRFLSKKDYEIIIVEDGSTDKTPEVAKKLAEKFDQVRYLHSDERLGKGKSLTMAFREGKGRILAFVDVDLATDLQHLPELIKAVDEEGYDISIGSRLLPNSKVNRGIRRTITSKVFNKLVRLLLGSDLRDHQCGFKAFRRDIFENLASEVKSDHLFWDSEFLVKAQNHGYRVKEIPVRWKDREESKVSLRDHFSMGQQLLQTFGELKIKPLLTKRLIPFALIGVFGAILNTGLLFSLTEFLGLFYLFSSAIAVEICIITQFVLNNRFTFTDSKTLGAKQFLTRLAKSNSIRLATLFGHIGLLYVFTELFGIYYLMSNLITIMIVFGANYLLESKITWRTTFYPK